MADSIGSRLSGVFDIDFALQIHMAVELGELSYFDFRLLRILSEERNAYEAELVKKQQSESHGGRQ